jgi:hypothetical protein
MKRFVRRLGKDDREWKLIARADQRRADLQRAAMTPQSESMTLNTRALSPGARAFEDGLRSPGREWGTRARLVVE